MRNIVVLSRKMIEEFKPDTPHVCISITDPDREPVSLPPDMTRLDCLRLSFDDIDFLPDTVNEKEPVIFTKEMAWKIIEFVMAWREEVDWLLINCEAGISRSSAVGAGVAKLQDYDDQEFFDKFQPNRFVYRTILTEGYNNNAKFHS